MNLRPYTPADLDAIVALEQVCFTHPWTRASFAVLPLLAGATFLVAEQAGELVGYVGMQTVLDEGQILNVATAPQARGQGVATALLSALFAKGAASGVTFYTLEVRESNTPAIALYQKHGFAEVGRRKNYYTQPTEDAILMTKECQTDEDTQH